MQLIPGNIYRIRLTNGIWTDGEFLHIHKTNWLKYRNTTHYIFRNVRTGREIEIKSTVRIKELPCKPTE